MDFLTLSFGALSQDFSGLLPLVLSVLLGIALSASCGFRLFVPPMVLSAAGLFFNVPLPEGMAWLATLPTFCILATAVVVEIGAYYLPWLDHFLDTITTPLSVVAGTLLTSALIDSQLDPATKWTIALVAGGGTAGIIQTATVTGRLASSLASFGLTNPIIATVENILAVILAVSSVVLPVVAIGLALVTLILLIIMVTRFRKRPAQNTANVPKHPG